MLTIGHSVLAFDAFLNILLEHGASGVIDVRTVPRSRRNPQFNRDTLPQALASAGVGYVWMSRLGGLRRTVPGSVNQGWRNLSFRGYADYMQTPAFEAAIEGLLGFPNGDTLVLMCAESLPWRCHRSLIADALLVRQIAVEHIIGKAKKPHVLTPFARVEGASIIYPA